MLASIALTIRRTAIDSRQRMIASCYRTFSNASGPVKEDGNEEHQIPLTAAAIAKESAELKPPRPRLDQPVQNWRDLMSALDLMIEEAEKKVEKKYRPNMFAEFKQLNDTNGKVLEGTEELIAVDKAKSVPSLIIKSLNDDVKDLEKLVTQDNHITLVCTSFKIFGFDMLPPWYEPFLAEFDQKSNSFIRVVSLNIIEDWYFRAVKFSIHRGLRQRAPDHLVNSTFTHFGRCDPFRTALDLYNTYVGYVHLVDAKGRIRWIAGGPVTPEELERLKSVTRQLMDQQTQSKQRRRR